LAIFPVSEAEKNYYKIVKPTKDYKHCPRVAAVSRTQKNTKKPRDLDLWPMTFKFYRIIEVVRYMCVQNFIKPSAAVYELSTAHQISVNCRLWSRISLEWIKQSTRENAETALPDTIFPSFDENNLVNFGTLTKNDLDLW